MAAHDDGVVECPACLDHVDGAACVRFRGCSHWLCLACAAATLGNATAAEFLRCPTCSDMGRETGGGLLAPAAGPGAGPGAGHLLELDVDVVLAWSAAHDPRQHAALMARREEWRRWTEGMRTGTESIAASSADALALRCAHCGVLRLAAPACAAATCAACAGSICSVCGGAWQAHDGPGVTCAEKKASAAAARAEYARQFGGKVCPGPSCSAVLVHWRGHGSHHVVCRCGFRGCFVCLAPSHGCACEPICSDVRQGMVGEGEGGGGLDDHALHSRLRAEVWLPGLRAVRTRPSMRCLLETGWSRRVLRVRWRDGRGKEQPRRPASRGKFGCWARTTMCDPRLRLFAMKSVQVHAAAMETEALGHVEGGAAGGACGHA
jgi:hypothetical protein